MRVLVADKLHPHTIDSLRHIGLDVVVNDCDGDALHHAIVSSDPQSLVVKSTMITQTMMEHAPSLELIVRAGAGYDTIDVDVASELGIFVANCPGKNASAVAELTIGLMVALDRRIPNNVFDAQAGLWRKGMYSKASGLRGRILGLIGLGHIGQLVAEAAKSMGIDVVGWSRSLTEKKAHSLGIRYLSSPLEIASQADIISLHIPAIPDTFKLANRDFFNAMKPGALFINTSRGSIVDEGALLEAVNNKGILAGLDVFESEPEGKEGHLNTELSQHPLVYLTHHIGASTDQAQIATGKEVVRVIDIYSRTGVVPNCINIAEQSYATHVLTIRHLDKVGVLAGILDLIRKYNMNIQEMENQVFTGDANAAVARIRVVGSPPKELCRLLKEIHNVLAVSCIQIQSNEHQSI